MDQSSEILSRHSNAIAASGIASTLSLRQSPVLCLDLQTTDTSPNYGHPLELAWLVSSVDELEAGGPFPQVYASVLALPEGERVPPDVARLTGIEDSETAAAPEAALVFERLFAEQSPICLIHYARFELSFLNTIRPESLRGTFPWEIVCTHQLSRRLLPGLPAWGIRAVSGHFGDLLPSPQRARDHAEATLRIWCHLSRRLEHEGVRTLSELKEWLTRPKTRYNVTRGGRRRSYLVSRESRLALPSAPGVYRMTARNGTILYVGKATSLRQRVSSYFRERTRRALRLSEMLAQVAEVKVTPTETALEAALLEADEIKKWNPRYNTSLRAGSRRLAFTSRDLGATSGKPDRAHSLGPFPSLEPLERLAGLSAILQNEVEAESALSALWRGVEPPDRETFDAGVALALPANWERDVVSLLRRGGSLLRRAAERQKAEGDRDGVSEAPEEQDERAWTPPLVAESIDKLLMRAARAIWRGRWITSLVESSLAWDLEQGKRRVLVIQGGQLAAAETHPTGTPPHVPPGWRTARAERMAGLDIAAYDRLRIILTEIRRLTEEETSVQLRLGPCRTLSARTLKRWLS